VRRLVPVALFGIAMAYLEAAVVVYLRLLMGIVEPARDAAAYNPVIAAVEVGREAATLVMLGALGWACGRNLQSRLGYFVFSFGVWDIFYYVWLKALAGWPGSLLTPDILFLIPIPWWGPVLTPVLIAFLMTASGTAAIALDDRDRPLRPAGFDWLPFPGPGAQPARTPCTDRPRVRRTSRRFMLSERRRRPRGSTRRRRAASSITWRPGRRS
jgi:hypothetical protein